MSDYISEYELNILQNMLEGMASDVYDKGEKDFGLRLTVKDAFTLSHLVPKKRGRWIVKHFGDDAQCSECGWSFADAYDADSHDRFCRHCGTEMCDLVLENKK